MSEDLVTVIIRFSDPKRQDIFATIMELDNCSLKEAVESVITPENYVDAYKIGWLDMALDLWGHGEGKGDFGSEPYSTTPKKQITLELEQEQYEYITTLVEKYEISASTAVVYMALIELRNRGFHL